MFSGGSNIRAVQVTRELTRVLNLPRRTWTPEEGISLAAELTAALKRPEGTMSLWPDQAMALLDAATLGHFVGGILVGGGKTLITGMLPYVMRSRRPLLITRANLVEKTKREFRELARHWPIPNFIRIVSYELLGRSGKDLLKDFQPDLVMLDEAHKAKNLKAKCTRVIKRYREATPTAKICPLSGTLARRSLRECAHLYLWAFGAQNAPVPTTFSDLEDWSEALDERPLHKGPRQVMPGALMNLCTIEERQEGDIVLATRRAFRRRLTETPGVVASCGEGISASLTIQALEFDVSPNVDEAFRYLREKWRTPDDWPIADPMTFLRHAKEMALEFYYIWDPRPPNSWIQPKKEWAAICRHILTTNRRELDSEIEVINAIDRGLYPEALPILEAWRAVKSTFTPNTVPVWLGDSAIDAAARWSATAPGIVWCEHRAFAERLALKTGLSYYGRGGLDKLGRPIEQHDPESSLIASIASSGEGRNLQAWNRALVTSPASSWSPGIQWEQLIGREHRRLQEADEVTTDVIVTCIEHVLAFEQACRDAYYQCETLTGQVQKLMYADIVMPTSQEVSERPGPRWNRGK